MESIIFIIKLKIYFRDGWLLFDEVVIAISIILVLLDLTLNYGNIFTIITGSIRGIFRVLRIFLLMRKVFYYNNYLDIIFQKSKYKIQNKNTS